MALTEAKFDVEEECDAWRGLINFQLLDQHHKNKGTKRPAHSYVKQCSCELVYSFFVSLDNLEIVGAPFSWIMNRSHAECQQQPEITKWRQLLTYKCKTTSNWKELSVQKSWISDTKLLSNPLLRCRKTRNGWMKSVYYSNHLRPIITHVSRCLIQLPEHRKQWVVVCDAWKSIANKVCFSIDSEAMKHLAPHRIG